MAQQGFDSDHEKKLFDEVTQNAQQQFQESLSALTDLGVQVREIVQKNPTMVIAGAALLGFLAGLVVRRSEAGFREVKNR